MFAIEGIFGGSPNMRVMAVITGACACGNAAMFADEYKHFAAVESNYVSPARCQIGTGATMANTEPVPGAPASGVAIKRASSAYERKKMVSLQTRCAYPMHAQVVVDGRTDEATVRAASDRDVEAQLKPDVPLGKHEIGIISGTQRSNTFPARTVTLTAEPLPPAPTGTVQTLTVHVDGLGGDDATMAFHVSGAAELVDGGENATVPVRNGIAHVRVRGTRNGTANIQFHLHSCRSDKRNRNAMSFRTLFAATDFSSAALPVSSFFDSNDGDTTFKRRAIISGGWRSAQAQATIGVQ